MDTLELETIVRKSVKEIIEIFTVNLEEEASGIDWESEIDIKSLSKAEIEDHIKRKLRQSFPILI